MFRFRKWWQTDDLPPNGLTVIWLPGSPNPAPVPPLPPIPHVDQMSSDSVLDELGSLGVYAITIAILLGRPLSFSKDEIASFVECSQDGESRAVMRAALLDARALSQTPQRAWINASLLVDLIDLSQAVAREEVSPGSG